ncbi:MAG: Uma2 family endonuclease [Lachnospiraceae bacterium]|nr:Uma2 family endonuclease [Lachnospiraceae bacterium]
MEAAVNYRKNTIEDIYALPEGKRAELIDGQLYIMATPSLTHQEILGIMFRKMANCIEAHKKECKVIIAPFAVFPRNDDSLYVEPDLIVVCDPSKLDEKDCHGAPDFITEIVSPSSKSLDHLKKLVKYRESGVREYWIVDPIEKSVWVYDFEKEEATEHHFGDPVHSVICEEFEMDFREFV